LRTSSSGVAAFSVRRSPSAFTSCLPASNGRSSTASAIIISRNDPPVSTIAADTNGCPAGAVA